MLRLPKKFARLDSESALPGEMSIHDGPALQGTKRGVNLFREECQENSSSLR
jgi:hypothetical protein